MGGAAARELVGRGGGRDPRRAGAGGRERRGREGHRTLRADARPGDSGRGAPGDSSFADLVRPAQPGASGFRQCQDRPRERAALHGEPGADRVHAAQTALGARQRAGQLRARAPDAAAQGLRALPADRRVRDRSIGRLGDERVRRGEAAVVLRDDGRARASIARFCRACLRIERGHGRDHGGGSGADGVEGRNAGGGRRRRSGVERGGQRNRGRGNRLLHAGNDRRGVRAHGEGGVRSRRARPHVLPRGARQVARDGSDAGRGAELAVVPQSAGAGRWRTTR